MKKVFVVLVLIFGLSEFIGCASSVGEKHLVEAKEDVVLSGTDEVTVKAVGNVAVLGDKELSPEDLERLNRLKEVIAANKSIIEGQVREARVEIKSGEEVAISGKELKETLKNIEVSLDDIQEKSTVGSDKNVSDTP